MTIEVVVNEHVDDVSFPMLMSAPIFDKHQIILVTGKNKAHDCYIGTNVNGVGNDLGYFSDRWSLGLKPFYGTVTLKSK